MLFDIIRKSFAIVIANSATSSAYSFQCCIASRQIFISR